MKRRNGLVDQMLEFSRSGSRRSSSDDEIDDEPGSNSKSDDTKDLEDDCDVKDGKEKELKDKKESTHKLLTRSSRTTQLLRFVRSSISDLLFEGSTSTLGEIRCRLMHTHRINATLRVFSR